MTKRLLAIAWLVLAGASAFVPQTFAAPDLLVDLTGYKPATPLSEGVARFVAWYREYYKV